jgi:hypothetical protein
LKAYITGTTVIEPLLSPGCRYSRSPLRSDGCHRGKAGEGFGGSVRDYATQLAWLTGISLKENRLKNRFSSVFSNGDFK